MSPVNAILTPSFQLLQCPPGDPRTASQVARCSTHNISTCLCSAPRAGRQLRSPRRLQPVSLLSTPYATFYNTHAHCACFSVLALVETLPFSSGWFQSPGTPVNCSSTGDFCTPRNGVVCQYKLQLLHLIQQLELRYPELVSLQCDSRRMDLRLLTALARPPLHRTSGSHAA